MFLYWALADYGRSFLRPFAWLIASGFFFYWCYGMILAPLAPKTGPLGDEYDHAVRMLALGNTGALRRPAHHRHRDQENFYSALAAMLIPRPFRRKTINCW